MDNLLLANFSLHCGLDLEVRNPKDTPGHDISIYQVSSGSEDIVSTNNPPPHIYMMMHNTNKFGCKRFTISEYFLIRAHTMTLTVKIGTQTFRTPGHDDAATYI